MEKLTISIVEMSEQLGISKPTAYKLANTKGFPILHLGKRKVIPVNALRVWLDDNTDWRT